MVEECAKLLEDFAEGSDIQGEWRISDELKATAVCVRGLKVPGEMVQCICCDGDENHCKEQVESWSRSHMCVACANEECEHGDDPF